ncbi:hypothetical protein D187_001769 [Cystobacter fuscus DSM 2262]|uniref:Uncharacterized protein n=1 Tax=Cystobacter fuscus (strain ATCC 25194 / DSM 2262 / NBRC 100088 / M29) TaxID=1242864 RepID=S9P881_CYSF2|nr:hypothetical protein D187_001769 [Cystobacter fuscus DSM 2262]
MVGLLERGTSRGYGAPTGLMKGLWPRRLALTPRECQPPSARDNNQGTRPVKRARTRARKGGNRPG